jgi:hypothetical protein
MKRFFIVIGVVFFLMLLVVGSFIGYMAATGPGLDASSKEYVDRALPAIVREWSADSLLARASPQLLQGSSEAQLRGFFSKLSEKLGSMTGYPGSQGDSNTFFSLSKGRIVSARYHAHIRFQRGEADINLMLFQDKAGKWSIAGFQVLSPALMQ